MRHMLTHDAWTTGYTLTTIGVGIGILGLVAGYFYANPRRRLYYGMPRVTRLLAASTDVDNLEIRRRGKVLQDPYVADLQLIARSRRDIPSDSFDKDEPLRLDLGVGIVEILQSPPKATTPPPKAVAEGTELLVGPDLISRRCNLTYTLLTEGKPTLTAASRLVDVQVRKSGDESPRSVVMRAIAALVVAYLMFAVIGIALMLSVLSSGSSEARVWSVPALMILLTSAVASTYTIPRLIRELARDTDLAG
jgi:hypothetical protein